MFIHKWRNLFTNRILELEKIRNNKQASDVTIDFRGTVSVSVVAGKDYGFAAVRRDRVKVTYNRGGVRKKRPV